MIGIGLGVGRHPGQAEAHAEFGEKGHAFGQAVVEEMDGRHAVGLGGDGALDGIDLRLLKIDGLGHHQQVGEVALGVGHVAPHLDELQHGLDDFAGGVVARHQADLMLDRAAAAPVRRGGVDGGPLHGAFVVFDLVSQNRGGEEAHDRVGVLVHEVVVALDAVFSDRVQAVFLKRVDHRGRDGETRIPRRGGAQDVGGARQGIDVFADLDVAVGEVFREKALLGPRAIPVDDFHREFPVFLVAGDDVENGLRPRQMGVVR